MPSNPLLTEWDEMDTEAKKGRRKKRPNTTTVADLADPNSDEVREAIMSDMIPLIFRHKLMEVYEKSIEPHKKKKTQEVHPSMVAISNVVRNPITIESVRGLTDHATNIILNEVMNKDTGDIKSMVEWVRAQQLDTIEQAAFCLKVFGYMPHGVSFQYGKYRYPIQLKSRFYTSWYGTYLTVSGEIQLTDFGDYFSSDIIPKMFQDSMGNPQSWTVDEILESFGFSVATDEEIEEFRQLSNEARVMNDKTGLAVDLTGNGFYQASSMFRKAVTSSRMGSVEHPGNGVVEKELEIEEDWNCISPFVRIFNMELKTYIAVDVRDIREHKYDKTILDRLILSDEIGPIVKTVFESDPEKIFGDLVKGRHGGMVIMASGPPGVGKTFTAESFAEYSERPLYIMSMGELGTNMVELEKNLKLIFLRAARWNAILLFDEAEVFLAKRGTDLERSAIVGVFLRMLDYYRGLFFLTTNMPEMIDEAFLSRITLHLKFGQMSWDVRTKIWERMIDAAKIQTQVQDDWSRHKELEINGRQIRNVCRLAKIIYGDKPVSVAEMCKVANLSCHHG